MPYIVYPSGTPNHTVPLEARLSTVTVTPYIPSGSTIQWRIDGTVVKTGTTSNDDDIRINTGNTLDVNFDSGNTGSVVDFVIDGTTISSPVILSNNLPTVTASIMMDSYNRISRIPTISWQYSDMDNDRQYAFRIKVGSISGGSDLFDSGVIYGYAGDANGDNVVNTEDIDLVNSLIGISYPSTSYLKSADFNGNGTIDSADLSIANKFLGTVYSSSITQTFSYQLPVFLSGQNIFYALYVSDGQKVTPTDPDTPEPARVFVSTVGSASVNSVPQVKDLTIESQPSGAIVGTKTPIFGWTYIDNDSQPQQAYRIKVSADSSFQNIIWDSGKISNSNNTVKYNFNGTGQPLPSHSVLYFMVTAWDTFDESIPLTGEFTVQGNPSIIVCTVDDKVNPKNLKNTAPTFKWQYEDIDLDPLTAYDIRVANDNTDLGTDAFVGNIWHPEINHTPESYQTVFNSDGKAFAGCFLPKQIEPNTTYYFQLKIFDAYGESDWHTGFFRLNNSPTVANISVLPLTPYGNDDLEAYYEFVDDPGEYESSLTEIKWYKSSSPAVEVVELANQKTVPSSYTSPGQIWYFTVRPNDGVDFGPLYTSPIVVISNRIPQAVILGINPREPRAGQEIVSSFILSDPDGDVVSAAVEWYKNGVSQPDLRNSNKVPSGYIKARDKWLFTVLPYDGYDYGQMVKSEEITVSNSIPEIISINVDGIVIPQKLTSKNPTVSWMYSDFDNDPQKAYRIIIGTKPIRVSKSTINKSTPKLCATQNQGIISISRSDADVLQGNDVYDSGEINSSSSSHKYLTEDYIPVTTLTSLNVERYFRYGLSGDLKTMQLTNGSMAGDVSFIFSGQASTYEVGIEYVGSSLKSYYRLLVDGILIDEFRTEGNEGSKIKVFRPCRLQNNSRISISGSSVDVGARAPFNRLSCVSISKLEVKPSSMILSGYSGQEDGSVKLSSLSGTATTSFPFPSGVYDVEIQYQTETSGNPNVILSVNAISIMNLNYESGAQVRSKIISGVSIGYGDQIKLLGSKSGNASARVLLLMFRPVQKGVYGSELKDGMPYYVSIKTYDGYNWSDWYSTRFFMEGSVWSSRISNSVGWTIETTMKLLS